MIVRTSPSISYSIWLRNIIDAHVLQAWNLEQTDLRERQDEELNDLWTEIDDSQRQRLWGLSSDLNTLRDGETCVDSDWPPMSKQELARILEEAFHAKDWDKLLEHLRRPPHFIPRARVDYLRGRAWQDMGSPEVAVLFFDNASRLEPENPNQAVLALECLKAIDSWREILRRCDDYIRDRRTPSRLLFRAADAFHLYGNRTRDPHYYQEGIRAVDEGFARLPKPNQTEISSVLAAAYATKSLCLEQLGDIPASLEVFDQAIMRFPENTTLLTARGLLKQELHLPDALDDFRKAIAGGTEVVWPYLELARDALQSGRNNETVEWARKGLAVVQRGSGAGSLYELMAIASHRLHTPLDTVRNAFQSALELDPLSEQIQTNYEQFERLIANPEPQEPKWQLALASPSIAIRDVYSHLLAAA